MKLFASRAIDIRDAEGIAVRHDKTLDWCYVEEQLTPLAEAKEEPDILRQFDRTSRGVVAAAGRGQAQSESHSGPPPVRRPSVH